MKQVANYFHCSVDTIARYLKDYNIPSNSSSDYTDKTLLTPLEQEVVEGAMLGDGHLEKHKNGISACLRYCSKSKQHIEYINNYMVKYSSGIKYQEYCDKRTNKIYTKYSMRTKSNQGFTQLYDKWYINQVKHIPNNLILTPLICLIWYIGDGSLNNNKNSQLIKLSTHCFLKEEQEQILLPQLKQFHPCLYKAGINKKGQEQYCIYIPHYYIKDFLNYIGECPFEDYQYKWEYKEYLYKKPTNCKLYEKQCCDLYLQGRSYYSIAKQFSIEPSIVRYYLIKNNIYNGIDKTKNIIIQYNHGIANNIFKSMAEASKYFNISISYICQICNNKTNNEKLYFKKFKNLSKEEQVIIKNQFQDFFNNL